MDHGLLVGQQLSDTYRIVRQIAHGGMGAIYEAVHLRLGGKRYAIKVLASRYASNSDAVARFRREALITSGLHNEHIIEVHDFNVDGGLAYLVMELLVGEDLAARLKRARSLPIDAIARILSQLVFALDAAHRARIVHRDLKPQNIFLCKRDGRDDYVKVLDFGVSKLLDSSTHLTSEHALLGTPFYMAPEQAQGGSQAIDGRADVFALGAILWELLTGRMAFAAPTLSGALYKVCMVDPPDVHTVRSDLPPAVSMVLRRALAKDPADRSPDVVTLDREFAAALRGVAPDRVPPPAPGSMNTLPEVIGPASPGDTVASYAGEPAPRPVRPTALEGGAGTRAASGSPDHGAVPSAAAANVSPAQPASAALPAWMPNWPATDASAHPDTGAASRIATGSVYAPAPRSRRGAIRALAVACLGVAMVVTGVLVGVRAGSSSGAGAAAGTGEATVAAPPPRPPPAPASQPTDDVAIAFAVDPERAEIELRVDGIPITDRHLRRARSRTPLVVTAEATGYLPFRAEPVPDRDQTVVVTLQPSPPVAVKSAPPRHAPAPGATRAQPRPRSTKASTSAAAASSARTPDPVAPTREPPASTAPPSSRPLYVPSPSATATATAGATPAPGASSSPGRATSAPPDAGVPDAAPRPPPGTGTIFDNH